jgi:hypothetical protein
MRMNKDGPSFRVVVEFHAGYKGEEEPRRIKADGDDWAVGHILERKRILYHNTGRAYEEFICLINKKQAKLTIYSNGEHYLTFLKT